MPASREEKLIAKCWAGAQFQPEQVWKSSYCVVNLSGKGAELLLLGVFAVFNIMAGGMMVDTVMVFYVKYLLRMY